MPIPTFLLGRSNTHRAEFATSSRLMSATSAWSSDLDVFALKVVPQQDQQLRRRQREQDDRSVTESALLGTIARRAGERDDGLVTRDENRRGVVDDPLAPQEQVLDQLAGRLRREGSQRRLLRTYHPLARQHLLHRR